MSNNKDLLPWGWSITADDATVSCPSSSAILGTLAAVNLVVSILGVIFGNRRILNWLTCRCFFNDPDSHAYRWTWMINVGLQLGANVAIAYIFQKAPGYNADFEIWELMLFFTVRPRLSWITLGLLGPLSSQKGKKITVQRRLPMKGRAARRRAHRSQTPEVEDVWVHDFPWRNSAIAQVLAEIALQCIALYIMGRSAHFGVQKGFYKINNDLPSAARLMYAGALYYLITGTGMLIYEFIWLARTIKQEISDQDYALSLGFFVVANLFTTWMGSWIFWAGFVHLAGSLYCPPKLYAQGTIWGAFSLAGIVIGGGGA